MWAVLTAESRAQQTLVDSVPCTPGATPGMTCRKRRSSQVHPFAESGVCRIQDDLAVWPAQMTFKQRACVFSVYGVAGCLGPHIPATAPPPPPSKAPACIGGRQMLPLMQSTGGRCSVMHHRRFKRGSSPVRQLSAQMATRTVSFWSANGKTAKSTRHVSTHMMHRLGRCC
jgi:hypothetical protein